MTTASRDFPDQPTSIGPDDAPDERRFVLLAHALASILILLALAVLGVQAPDGGWAGLDAARTGASTQAPAANG